MKRKKGGYFDPIMLGHVGKSTKEGGKDEEKVTLLPYVGRAPIGSLKKNTTTERKRSNLEKLDKEHTIIFLTSPPLYGSADMPFGPPKFLVPC